jgi:alpha-D-ribose 1-methylphosphonate 5-triphosphate synthase subunit PhnH
MEHVSTRVERLPGFKQPVFDSQKTFRSILTAMANPGRIVTGPGIMKPPDLLNGATAAAALTLFDLDTPVWTDLPDGVPALGWMQFHCGNPVVFAPDQAAFALITKPGAMPSLDCFSVGEDARPELSTTLIIQVEEIGGGRGFELKGPGIKNGRTRLCLEGLSADFWQQRHGLMNIFPCGIDMIFTQADRMAALPRTIQVKV